MSKDAPFANSEVDLGNPLRDRKPLRVAGQSIDEEIERIFDDRAVPLLATSGLAIAIAIEDWWRWYTDAPPTPKFSTLMAAIICTYAVWRLIKLKRVIKRLALARDGERLMAEELALLRKRGAILFNDIKAHGFNLDHVLVAPQGIFTIETKTWRKVRGKQIELRANELFAGDLKADRNPLPQAKGQAAWVHSVLKEVLLDAPFLVQPVVLFHGWSVSQDATKSARREGVWLLSANAFPSWLANEPIRLTKDEMLRAAMALSQRARA